MMANLICESMIIRIDDEGRNYLLMDKIQMQEKDESAVTKDDIYILPLKTAIKFRRSHTRMALTNQVKGRKECVAHVE